MNINISVARIVNLRNIMLYDAKNPIFIGVGIIIHQIMI